MKKNFYVLLSFILLFSCSKRNLSEEVKEKISKNDLTSIQKILEKNLFTQEEYNSYAYLLYLKNNSISPVIKLVDHGLPVNTYCKNETLLEKAVLDQNLSEVKYLLANQADSLMFDKTNTNTALSLAIQQRGKNSVAIFKEILDTVSYSKFTHNDDDAIVKPNSVFWYYSQIIEKNQTDFLSIFLQNSFFLNDIINNKNTLILLVNNSNMFCKANEPVLNEKLLKVDNYEYFASALSNLNVQAVYYLMKNKIPMTESLSVIDSLTNFDEDGKQIQSAISTTDEAIELANMKQILFDYHSECLKNEFL